MTEENVQEETEESANIFDGFLGEKIRSYMKYEDENEFEIVYLPSTEFPGLNK
jgi:hypothetical protein